VICAGLIHEVAVQDPLLDFLDRPVGIHMLAVEGIIGRLANPAVLRSGEDFLKARAMDADGSAAEAGGRSNGEGILGGRLFVAVVADIGLAGKVDVGDGVLRFHFVVY
jgi:hypothetical protein